jgi:adenine phosphoribosyltransferase
MDLLSALSLIRAIPDYPKPGILFQDITPLLSNAEAFESIIRSFADLDDKADIAVGVEARGFILASALAIKRNIGFVPIRKKGKLPADTFTQSYGLEYGVDEVEIHCDAFRSGMKVTLIDDVLATGGTLEAAVKLINEAGAQLTSIIVLFEIVALKGRSRLEKIAPGIPIHALVKN